jgi:hypothetical protein
MAEVNEGLVVIDEGNNPETAQEDLCCWQMILLFY